MQAATRYAQLGRDRIAYQVLGQGPPDLVMTTASFGDIDVAWEDPGLALFYRTLASFSRLILLNRRGTGASDPLPPEPLPPWESYAEELAGWGRLSPPACRIGRVGGRPLDQVVAKPGTGDIAVRHEGRSDEHLLLGQSELLGDQFPNPRGGRPKPCTHRFAGAAQLLVVALALLGHFRSSARTGRAGQEQDK